MYEDDVVVLTCISTTGLDMRIVLKVFDKSPVFKKIYLRFRWNAVRVGTLVLLLRISRLLQVPDLASPVKTPIRDVHGVHHAPPEVVTGWSRLIAVCP